MKQKKKFTLIELMMVVNIISILISILLPALQNARRKVKQAVCLNNIKQIGLAVSSYLDENSDRYPRPVNGGGYQRGRIWIGRSGTHWKYPSDVHERIVNPHLGYETPGMQTLAALCPLSVGQPVNNYIEKGSSYFGNDYDQGTQWSDLGGGIFAAKIANDPSKLVLWPDGFAYSRALGTDYWQDYHHPGRAQFAFGFIDGSAKQLILQIGEGILWQSDKLTFVVETTN